MEDAKLVLVHTRASQPLQATTIGAKHGKRSGWKILMKKAKSIVQSTNWMEGDSLEIFMVMEEGKMSSAKVLDQDDVLEWKTNK